MKMGLSRRRRAVTAGLAAIAAAPSASAAADGAPERVLQRAEALLQPSRAKGAAPADPARGRALSPILGRLATLQPRLGGARAGAARAILLRPDDGEDDRYGTGYTAPEAPESPACTTNFCVHWVDSSFDELEDESDDDGIADGDGVPDFIEAAQDSAEESFATENGVLGWSEPKSDGTRGGGGPGQTDVYLIETFGRYFGYSSPDEGQGPITSKQGYLVLDNGYSEFEGPGLTEIEAMQVTMAHEYNHVLQFTLDSRQELWMLEATATWVEDHVYPEIDDYLNYVPSFASDPSTPLTNNGFASLRIYGAAEWNHYLDGTHDPAVVRAAWEGSELAAPAHRSVPAYDSALGGAGFPFSTLADEFASFTSTAPEWRARPDVFPDAAELPDVRRLGALKPGGHSFRGKLDHLSYALLRVRAGLAEDGLELRATGPEGVRYSIDLVARSGPATGGTVTAGPTVAVDGGRRKATLAAGSYDRVTAVIANIDSRIDASGRYAADDSRFRLKLSRER
jgi:hypothetical protein